MAIIKPNTINMNKFSNVFLLFSLFILAQFIVSCSKDDDNSATCTIQDFVGVYSGTYDGSSVNNVAIIIDTDGDLEMTINGESFYFYPKDGEIDNCKVISSNQNPDKFSLTLNDKTLSGTLNDKSLSITKGMVNTTCKVDDWVGSYVGTNCDGNVVVTLTKNTDGDLKLEVKRSGGTTSTTLFSNTIVGCSAVFTDAFGRGYNLKLEGDKLTGTYNLGKSCTLDLTKKALSCTFSSFLGNYTGTASCVGPNTVGEITSNGGGPAGKSFNLRLYDLNTFKSDEFTIGESELLDCTIESGSLVATLNGNTLSGSYKDIIGTVCTFSITK